MYLSTPLVLPDHPPAPLEQFLCRILAHFETSLIDIRNRIHVSCGKRWEMRAIPWGGAYT